jgi:hypothetical protein
MSQTQQVIEATLRVVMPDEATAVRVAEILARVSVSLSAEDAMVSLDVERFEQVCHHVTDEVEQ